MTIFPIVVEMPRNMLITERQIDHFTVACLVTWPLNESEAGGDLTLIETSWLFLC